MAKKPPKRTLAVSNDPERKQRTRGHVIADLSVNHVERLALKADCAMHRRSPDYGFDLLLETFSDKGNVENELVPLQLKATDGIGRYELATEEAFSFPVDVKDFKLWTNELMPVFLILYDAVVEEGYWLDIQEYERSHKPDIKGDTLHLHIPRNHVLGVQTIRMMRQRKNGCVERLHAALQKDVANG